MRVKDVMVSEEATRTAFLDRMARALAAIIDRSIAALGSLRARRRWQQLRDLGLVIGAEVDLPDSTWIDVAHCYLISIGDRCSFGPECIILAHDGQMDEFLDAGRLGRVTIHESCHIGARTIVLSNVEIGPRTVVAPGSVVGTSLPPDSYCAGSPARRVRSLEEVLEEERARMVESPMWDPCELDAAIRSAAGRKRVLDAVGRGVGYVRRRIAP